jgi:hypothetical protein
MSEQSTDDIERPDEWPEMFPDPDLDCNHHFVWDDDACVYFCIYCEVPRLAYEPPERHIDTDTDRSAGSDR